MGFFNLNTSEKSYLGVDIGSAGVKVVELKNENGRPRLVTYGFVEDTNDLIHDNSQAVKEKIAKMLVSINEKAQTTTRKAVVGLPSFSVFSSVISLPVMDKKNLSQAIQWQAKKFIPLPIDEMTLDWKILSNNVDVKILEKNEEKKEDDKKEETPKKSSENIKVLIAAAPKKLVLKYVDIFKMAGLEMASLETENFALERSLVGGSKSPVMIVDIGSLTSDITVVENGMPLLNRSVDVGGQTITKAIVNSMHVDEARAEQFKRDLGFSGQGNLPKIIETTINPIINEIKYCSNLYASQQSSQKIEKIVLTGGSSFLTNIDKHLSQLLNIKVIIGDPWARVIYPIELKSVLDNLAPRFSVAVGLAMREIV